MYLVSEYLLNSFCVPDIVPDMSGTMKCLYHLQGAYKSQKGRRSCMKLVTVKHYRCIGCWQDSNEEVIYFT